MVLFVELYCIGFSELWTNNFPGAWLYSSVFIERYWCKTLCKLFMV